jgi:hypothetical protein
VGLKERVILTIVEEDKKARETKKLSTFLIQKKYAWWDKI